MNTIHIRFEATNWEVKFIATGEEPPQSFRELLALCPDLRLEHDAENAIWYIRTQASQRVHDMMLLLHLYGHDLVRVSTLMGVVDNLQLIERKH